MAEKDAHGGNFGWKYAPKKQSQGGEGEFFLVASAVTLAVILVLTTLMFALFGAQWTLWHWVVMGVLGVLPAFFTVVLGIGWFADRR